MRVLFSITPVGLRLRLRIRSIRILGLQNKLVARSLADLRSFILSLLIQDEHGAGLRSQTLIVALRIVLLLRRVDLVRVRFGRFEIRVTLLFQRDIKLLCRWIVYRVRKILQVLIVPAFGDTVRFLVLDSHFSALAEFRATMSGNTSLLDGGIQFDLLQLLVFHIAFWRFVIIRWLFHRAWTAFNHDDWDGIVFFWWCYLLDHDVFDGSDLNYAWSDQLARYLHVWGDQQKTILIWLQNNFVVLLFLAMRPKRNRMVRTRGEIKHMLLYPADVVESYIGEVPVGTFAANITRVAGVEDIEVLRIKGEGLQDSLSACSRPVSNCNRPFDLLRILFIIQIQHEI